MPDYKFIYAHQAEVYEEMVACEDTQGNLLAAIRGICPLDGADVVELGAGTGRVTCLLAPHVKSLRIFDESPTMLEVAITKLKQQGWQHWQAQLADHLQLPVANGSAHLAISGWSLCYAALDHPQDWQLSLERALGEMRRVLRPGGTIIIIETQGTGFTNPNPPASLLDYFQYLDAHGFAFTWFRTDYHFSSLEEAERLTTFFFGDSILEKLSIETRQVILPECTGLWWKRV